MSVEGEFNTNVASREERIRVRQKRIEARTASTDAEGLSKTAEAREEKSKSKGAQAVADSLSTLDKKKSSGIEKVTDVRVAADWRESHRRVAEEKQRAERLQRLQEEAVRSGKANAAVELRWAELLDQNMAQELHDEIEAQKSACAEIIASKDAVIRDFQLQLKQKDEEYVKALKDQALDVQTMLTRMRTEFKELQNEYEAQLEAVEDAYLQERDDILAENKAEMDGLFEKRREMELHYMEKKQEREDQYQREIEDLLVKDAEEYSKLKIKLETDIQTLEQQLEEMRATYQLNTEKLEYNYRVLTERDSENSTTLHQLKRKQNKLKDTLHAVVQKYHETDARDRKKNDDLTEEYRRITKQYRDLQAKFRHFEQADTKHYDDVWAMHEEEVTELVSKVLKADEIIHSQQLGMDWRPPDLAALKQVHDLESEHPVDTTHAAVEGGTSQNLNSEIPGHKIKAVIELLIDEAGFLVDPSVKTALDTLTKEQADLAQAESLLRALGVHDERDVATLTEYFFKTPESNKDDDDEDDDDDVSAVKKVQTIIKPDQVIAAVTAFVQAKRQKALGKVVQRSAVVPVAHAAQLQAAKLQADRDKLFWKRLGDVVSDKNFRVWKQLELHLQKYNDILNARANEINAVKSLQEQNAQLKALLNQYLSAPINDELIVPPAQTIRLSPS